VKIAYAADPSSRKNTERTKKGSDGIKTVKGVKTYNKPRGKKAKGKKRLRAVKRSSVTGFFAGVGYGVIGAVSVLATIARTIGEGCVSHGRSVLSGDSPFA